MVSMIHFLKKTGQNRWKSVSAFHYIDSVVLLAISVKLSGHFSLPYFNFWLTF